MKRRKPLFGFLAGLFLGILMDLLILYLVIEYDLISKYSDTVLPLLQLFLILCPAILGVIGYRRQVFYIEKKLEGIKMLLKEHKSLTLIKKKIQGWKDEGYIVNELEEMLEEVK